MDAHKNKPEMLYKQKKKEFKLEGDMKESHSKERESVLEDRSTETLRRVEEKYYVYLLIDPGDNKPFYVGYGTWVNQRHLDHVQEYHDWVKAGRPEVRGWNVDKLKKIASILERKKHPDLKYEFIYRSDCLRNTLRKEGRVIRKIGLHKLTNISPGGMVEWMRYHKKAPESKRKRTKGEEYKAFQEAFFTRSKNEFSN